jgi:hypothetical protein
VGSALALALAVALGDALRELEGRGDALGDTDSVEVADGEALPDADGDADADEDADALGEIVDDGEAGADGDALAIGSTTQGSCGALICSVAGADASDAMAAVPVPKVAKIRLADTVMATPPERRTPRLRA